MNRKSVLWGVAGVLVVMIAGWTLTAASETERGEMYLSSGYVIGGVKLQEGKYLVIHDESKLKEGSACTYFYKMPYRPNAKAVAEVHCTPETGPRVDAFTMRSTRGPDGTSTVSSIQFAGSTEIHILPTN